MYPEQKDVAVLVHSCDRYEFLYTGFYYFFDKYWDAAINCQCYFATEEKNTTHDGFINIKSGKGEWTDRLTVLLKDKIKEKYIIYFQEDMWLNKNVSAGFFNQLFDLVKQKKWQQVKLHSSEVYHTIATTEFVDGFNVALVDNAASDFLMSHQVTLWDKEFLLQQLHKGEHPWRNERKGTRRLKKLNPEIFQIDYFAENGKAENNLNRTVVSRSEYHTISVNAVLGDSIKPYIDELDKAGPEYVKYTDSLKYHYINKVTHDGKQVPRKEGIFKTIKNWLKLKTRVSKERGSYSSGKDGFEL